MTSFQYIKYFLPFYFILISTDITIAQYDLITNMKVYEEISDNIELCKNNIPDKLYFTIDTPMRIFDEEVDSFFVYKWDRLNICLGKKDQKEFDMFVPLNSALEKSKSTPDLPDFSISYKLEGELGKRILTIQWKNVIPSSLFNQNDNFNFQVILSEEDQSVEYLFGKLPQFPNNLFIFSNQNKLMSIYFMNDFSTWSDSIFKIVFIRNNPNLDNLPILGYYEQIGAYYDDPYFNYGYGPLDSGYSFKFIYSPNSVKEQVADNATIFPNPSSDYIYFSGPSLLDKYSFKVFDLMGRSYDVIQNYNSLDIRFLPSNIYILNIVDNGKIVISKTFVKM